MIAESMQDYYTYDGSLTTPMCHESVRWIVFRDRMGLSRNQVTQSYHSSIILIYPSS
jgi:carbonic anhydrase